MPVLNSLRTEVKPSEVARQLRTCIAAKRYAMLHGDPGVGKTQGVWRVAAEIFSGVYGWSFKNDVLKNEKGKVYPFGYATLPWFREFRSATMDQGDFGVPMLVDGHMRWLSDEQLPTDERGGVIFLDEINRGTEAVINCMFALVDGKVHSYHRPITWVPCAAVNDKDIGARKLSSALLARFAHYDCITDLEDVCKVASVRGWEPEIVAYLRSFPNSLHAYNTKERVSPNPRAWEFISQILAAKPVPEEIFYHLRGSVGDGAAVEFMGFLKLWHELPSIDGILLNPDSAVVPNGPSAKWCVGSALARRATPQNFNRVLTYLERMPIEYNVASVRDAVRRQPALEKTAGFTQWCVAHSDITMGATA